MLHKKLLQSMAVVGMASVLGITAVSATTKDKLQETKQEAQADKNSNEEHGVDGKPDTSLDVQKGEGYTVMASAGDSEKKNTEKDSVPSTEQSTKETGLESTKEKMPATETPGSETSQTGPLATEETENPSTEGKPTETKDTEQQPPEEQTPPEPVLTEEQKAWQNHLMADVEEYLNVRASADINSEVLGKLYKGDLAVIAEPGTEWTQITSGNLTGYVKNEYCKMGLEALDYAKTNCVTAATSTVNGLRIRKEQSTESDIMGSLNQGAYLPVNLQTETSAEWVAVNYKDKVCYVSSQYVETSILTGTGITVQEEAEIAARKAAEEKAAAERAAKKAAEEKAAKEAAAKKAAEEKAAKEAAAKEAAAKQGTGNDKTNAQVEIRQNAPISATDEEFILLATLIYCEAGAECYEAQLGVGAVVMNRMRSNRFPSGMKDVIYQKGQFTPAYSGLLARRLKSGEVSETAKRAAREALSGIDNTNGCLFFNDIASGGWGIKYGAVAFH